MILGYKTKRDINGNTYFLYVNLENKTITNGYNTSRYSDVMITTTKKDLHEIQAAFEANGFITNYV